MAAVLLLLALAVWSPGGTGHGVAAQQATDGGGPNAPGPVQTSAPIPGPVTGVRACLPFTILVAPPPPSPDTTTNATSASASAAGSATDEGSLVASAAAASGNATSTDQQAGGGNATTPSGGQIFFTAEEAVIDAINISITDGGVLVLSVDDGFRTRHTINLTIVTSSIQDLRWGGVWGGAGSPAWPGSEGRGKVCLGGCMQLQQVPLSAGAAHCSCPAAICGAPGHPVFPSPL